MDSADRDPIERARALVAGAELVTALTGAGISTESGIPDFRGPQGLWTKDPTAEKMATLQHYVADPDVRRRAWQSRVDSPVWGAVPNAGHRALVDLERRGKLAALVTQNTDGLHQAAGSDPALVVEVHGTMRQVTCLGCGDTAPMQRALDRVRSGEDDPPCRRCGGILKSATISFGQSLVAADLARADAAARACDVLLAVGSTLAVYPVAAMVPVAASAGAAVVIVNGGPTAMDDVADVVVRGPIGETLPAICG